MPPSSSLIRIGNHRRKDLHTTFQYILSLANMYISNLNQISRGKERKSSTRFSKPWPRFSRADKSVDDKEEQRRGKREGLVPRGEAREEIIREGRACIKPCAGSVSSRVSSVPVSRWNCSRFKASLGKRLHTWTLITIVSMTLCNPLHLQNLYLPTEIIDFSLLSTQTLSCFSVPRFKWEKKKNYNA